MPKREMEIPCRVGKAVSINIVCVRILALVIRHANRKFSALYYIAICGALPYFQHYLVDGAISGTLFNIICVFLFSLQILSTKFLILRIILRDIIINVHRSSYKLIVIHVRG
jgi:hypothetical protein